MKMKTLAIALMAGLLATPALADEPKTSWSGVYLGGHGGMDFSSTAIGLGPIGIDGISTNGAAFGLNAGADWPMPGTMIVLGIGGDYTWSDSEFKVTFGPATVLSAGFEESWAVFGRVGLDAGRVMPYVLAGYTEADVSAAIGGVNIGGRTLHGWLVGGGMEMKIAGGVTLGAEYRYSMFDTLTLAPGFTLDTDRHEVRATLKYKFSGMY